MRIDPYRDAAVGQRGLGSLIFSGRAEEALPIFDRGIALDPQSRRSIGSSLAVPRPISALAITTVLLRTCEKYLALEDDWYPHIFLVGAYAQKGNMAKAAADKAEAMKRDRNLSIARLKALRLWRESGFIATDGGASFRRAAQGRDSGTIEAFAFKSSKLRYLAEPLNPLQVETATPSKDRTTLRSHSTVALNGHLRSSHVLLHTSR